MTPDELKTKERQIESYKQAAGICRSVLTNMEYQIIPTFNQRKELEAALPIRNPRLGSWIQAAFSGNIGDAHSVHKFLLPDWEYVLSSKHNSCTLIPPKKFSDMSITDTSKNLARTWLVCNIEMTRRILYKMIDQEKALLTKETANA